MANIELSYNWAVERCGAPNVGYSQAYRNEETVDGITYYDCSSFIYFSLKNGAFDVGSYPFNTTGMLTELPRMGFEEFPISGEWKKGDVVWKDGHTEMVYTGGSGGGITMGAHTDEVPLADQVSINKSPTASSYYTKLFRYGGGITPPTPTYEWIVIKGEAEYLPLESQKNNAACFYYYYKPKGWTLEAIAGACGNLQQESTFNPGITGTGGGGLIGWTPLENLIERLRVIVGYTGTEWEDPDRQLQVIDGLYEESAGTVDYGFHDWLPTAKTPETFPEFAHSTASPEYLSEVWQRNLERPSYYHEEREGFARNWYEYLKTLPDEPGPTPPGPTPTKRKKAPIWIFMKRRIF